MATDCFNTTHIGPPCGPDCKLDYVVNDGVGRRREDEMTTPTDEQDQLYLDLKGARERLCRAQGSLNPTEAGIIQGALARIDLVGCDLPQWSRHDGGRA
jgi:hypothetical protein